MARYDRIAPLPAPPRERAFPGWPVLLDLQGRERQADLASRARLRFLALRPLRRILRHGPSGVPPQSLRAQVEGIREELGVLPARDPERLALRAYLDALSAMDAGALCSAVFSVATVAAERSELSGAEEIARSGLELARVQGAAADLSRGHRLLGGILRHAGRLEPALLQVRQAADFAEQAGERREWAAAVHEEARILRQRGDIDGCDAAMERVKHRAEQWDDAAMRAYALSAMCDERLEREDFEAAAGFGWEALALEREPSNQLRLLRRLALALQQLGMYQAAADAHRLVAERSSDWESRASALAMRAEMAAAAGDAGEFQRQLDSLAGLDAGQGLLASHLEVQLAIGRGMLAMGDRPHARERLHLALDLAALEGNEAAAATARRLLDARSYPTTAPGGSAPAARAQSIASELRASRLPLAH